MLKLFLLFSVSKYKSYSKQGPKVYAAITRTINQFCCGVVLLVLDMGQCCAVQGTRYQGGLPSGWSSFIQM